MTELQLKVMRVLWAKGEMRAIEVQEALAPDHDLAITTVSTLLTRMVKRGDLVTRKSGRHFFFSPRVSEAEVSARKLNEVADLLFSGSAAAAIAHLLDNTDLDANELRALQKRIAEKEASSAGKKRS